MALQPEMFWLCSTFVMQYVLAVLPAARHGAKEFECLPGHVSFRHMWHMYCGVPAQSRLRKA